MLKHLAGFASLIVLARHEFISCHNYQKLQQPIGTSLPTPTFLSALLGRSSTKTPADESELLSLLSYLDSQLEITIN